MALYGSNTEYGLHCLLLLVGSPQGRAVSAGDLAEFQGVSPSLVAKLFTRLEKAGLVQAAEGIRGGFRLARPADQISVLEVVDELEGEKRLFDCKEVRANCTLFGDAPPRWATRGLCGIHRLMRDAEDAMRQTLRQYTLADLSSQVLGKLPTSFQQEAVVWFQQRSNPRSRRAGRHAGGSA